MQLRIRFSILLAVLLQLVSPRLCMAEFESYSAFEGETPSPNFEQQASLDPALFENQVVTIKPFGITSKGDSEFKHFGLSWVKQSALMGGRAGYAWPMAVENTSLGLVGSYLTDRRREQRIGAGIESVSYFGEKLQTGWFLSGALGADQIFLKTKKRTTRKISSYGGLGMGYSIQIAKTSVLHVSVDARIERTKTKNQKLSLLAVGLRW